MQAYLNLITEASEYCGQMEDDECPICPSNLRRAVNEAKMELGNIPTDNNKDKAIITLSTMLGQLDGFLMGVRDNLTSEQQEQLDILNDHFETTWDTVESLLNFVTLTKEDA